MRSDARCTMQLHNRHERPALTSGDDQRGRRSATHSAIENVEQCRVSALRIVYCASSHRRTVAPSHRRTVAPSHRALCIVHSLLPVPSPLHLPDLTSIAFGGGSRRGVHRPEDPLEAAGFDLLG